MTARVKRSVTLFTLLEESPVYCRLFPIYVKVSLVVFFFNILRPNSVACICGSSLPCMSLFNLNRPPWFYNRKNILRRMLLCFMKQANICVF
jgi:hypothetical protein